MIIKKIKIIPGLSLKKWLRKCNFTYCSKLHAYRAGNKLVIKVREQWMQRRRTAGSAFQHAARQNSLCLSAEVEGANVYQGEQSRHKGERNTMCACASVCVCVCIRACVSLCVHWRMVVRVLCFTVFCHDALLYYSAQGALHMRNGFSLISTAAWGRECTQKQARANLFWEKNR